MCSVVVDRILVKLFSGSHIAASAHVQSIAHLQGEHVVMLVDLNHYTYSGIHSYCRRSLVATSACMKRHVQSCVSILGPCLSAVVQQNIFVDQLLCLTSAR